ncbi:MAG: 6-bladed beta-propeller [Candidatus Eisenbacteria bacterium]
MKRTMPLLLTALLLAPMPSLAAGANMKQVDKPSGSGSYTLRSTLELGGPNASDEAQFFEKLGRIGMGADASGNIYVLDNGNLRIQVFDKNGKFLRSFGHEGEGPGEFKMPGPFSVNGQGEIALFDLMTQRVSVLDAQGKLLRDKIAERVVKSLQLLDDGTLILAYGGTAAPKFEALSSTNTSLWQYGGEAPSGERTGRNLEIAMGSRAQLVGRTGQRVLLGSDQEYGVTLFDGSQAIAAWKRPFERQPMPSMADMARARGSDKDSEGGGRRVVMITRQEGDAGVSTSVSSGPAAEKQITINSGDLADLMPKFQPDLQGVLAWPDGRIWVMTSEKQGDNFVTDEWSASGDYLKRFELSGDYDWLAVGADGQLYGLTHDKEEFPIVHRLAVDAAR